MDGMSTGTVTRKRILFVEQNDDGTVGGSHHSLLLLIRHLDRAEFEPIVAFYERRARRILES